MKKLIVLLLVAYGGILCAQNADFETVGFEIKPIAMVTAERSLLTYNFEKDEFPSMFSRSSLAGGTLNKRDTSPMIFKTEEGFANKNTPISSPIDAPILNVSQVYAFTNDVGNNSRVKNIAYKPASGGNIADAYCNALYAARAEGRQ